MGLLLISKSVIIFVSGGKERQKGEGGKGEKGALS